MDSYVVICAMETEATHLRQRLDAVEEGNLFHWRSSRGMLGDAHVEIVVCGIGMVQAASAATAVCIEREPTAVLNYGCSGAHQETIACGDVVVGERSVHLGAVVVMPDGTRRPMGFDPNVDGADLTEGGPFIASDAHLLGIAREIAGLELPAWPGNTAAPEVHFGTVGSADVWTQHGETLRWLEATYKTLCEDMEAAAIGQVCQAFGVPFLTVKDISNNELQLLTDMGPGSSILGHVEAELGLRASLLIEQIIRNVAS